jgi:hypothetical protein
MSTVEKLIGSLPSIEPERYETLPDIELYMDQLVEYLSRAPMSLRKGDRLTGAMVNNYIKSGLLPRARGKRYARQHIADLAMIVRLKQVLSVSDTGALLALARRDDAGYYDHFCETMDGALKGLADRLAGYGGSPQALAMELALDSYVKKVACEYLISALDDDKK